MQVKFDEGKHRVQGRQPPVQAVVARCEGVQAWGTGELGEGASQAVGLEPYMLQQAAQRRYYSSQLVAAGRQHTQGREFGEERQGGGQGVVVVRLGALVTVKSWVQKRREGAGRVVATHGNVTQIVQAGLGGDE